MSCLHLLPISWLFLIQPPEGENPITLLIIPVK